MFELNIKKLHPDSDWRRGSLYSGGIDLKAVSVEVDREREIVSYGLGVAVSFPHDYVCLLCSRSSVSKKDLIQKNCIGIIDSDYRGELKVVFQIVGGCRNKHREDLNIYQVGDFVCQILFFKNEEYLINQVDELPGSERGERGFGSSGN